VNDEDVAFDDAMGSARFSLSEITPQMICRGWVLLNPFGGVASTLMRVQVDGTGQNCQGLLPTMMDEVTITPDEVPVTTQIPAPGSAAPRSRRSR
jgi:hypothetical protein